MKEGISMEQKILDLVERRINKLDRLKQQIEKTKKQIDKKRCEISEFREEWEKNCEHVFYRVQLVAITPYTVGYHCCLCGTFEKLQSSSNTEHRQSSKNYGRRKYFRTSSRTVEYREVRKPNLPPPPKETRNFIGTVTESGFANKEPRAKEERFPIPPEYQAEVASKRAQLDELRAELVALEEKLKKLEATKATIEHDLMEATHQLNSYFDYPEVVYREPHRWTRDDFNYDPFD